MRAMDGLSPRVRGNLNHLDCPPAPNGSIPARAGEPASGTGTWRRSTVYLRACGGTAPEMNWERALRGLSPRVRGNPTDASPKVFGQRSIPARAGEPPARGRRARPGRVYPRACGGTMPRTAAASNCRGLSPRVRGNQLAMIQPPTDVRSIPARAGEPRRCFRVQLQPGVYPRACGGTASCKDPVVVQQPVIGLSPRVRGNPAGGSTTVILDGSIPARAGEPARG